MNFVKHLLDLRRTSSALGVQLLAATQRTGAGHATDVVYRLCPGQLCLPDLTGSHTATETDQIIILHGLPPCIHSMLVTAAGFLTLPVLQWLDQRTADAMAALKLNRGVGNVKAMLKEMFNPVQHTAPLLVIFRLQVNMDRKRRNM